MNLLRLLCLSTSLTFTAPASAEPVAYTIDSVHSGINFRIRHFINKVPGTFKSFSGEIIFDPEDPAASKVTATIQAATIDTRNSKRDAHLKNEDFLHVGQFETITFESTGWIPIAAHHYKVTGNLTILGQSHPVELDVHYLGEVEARGKIRSGWEATTTIDRTQWGITYSPTAIGNQLEIDLSIQAHRQ